MSESRGQKRPKSYYRKCAKKGRGQGNRYMLEPRQQGVLITCNTHEKEAVGEAYNLLNEYADRLFGSEQLDEETSERSDEEDVEQELQKEVEKLKHQKTERRFQNVQCRVNNCIFIKCVIPDVNKLVHSIMSDIFETGILKARHIIKIVPVVMTCGTSMEGILKTANEIFGEYFETPLGSSQTYSIIYKARNNTSVSRNDVISELAGCIEDMNQQNKVYHDNPDYTILINILCTVCCISVVKDFKKFRSYNIHEVAKLYEQNQIIGDKPDVTNEKQDKRNADSTPANEKKDDISGTISTSNEMKDDISGTPSTSNEMKDDISGTPSTSNEMKDDISGSMSTTNETKDDISGSMSTTNEVKDDISGTKSSTNEMKDDISDTVSTTNEMKDDLIDISGAMSSVNETKDDTSGTISAPNEVGDNISYNVSVTNETQDNADPIIEIQKDIGANSQAVDLDHAKSLEQNK